MSDQVFGRVLNFPSFSGFEHRNCWSMKNMMNSLLIIPKTSSLEGMKTSGPGLTIPSVLCTACPPQIQRTPSCSCPVFFLKFFSLSNRSWPSSIGNHSIQTNPLHPHKWFIQSPWPQQCSLQPGHVIYVIHSRWNVRHRTPEHHFVMTQPAPVNLGTACTSQPSGWAVRQNRLRSSI